MNRPRLRLTLPLRWLLGVLAGLFLAGTVPAQAPALQGKFKVKDVLTHGNNLVPSQRIMSIIKTRPGTDYRQDVVNDDVKELYKTHQFGNIRVEVQPVGDPRTATEVVVHFEFLEYPGVIQEIVYQGANHFKTDELNTVTGLRKGAPLNPPMNKLACNSVVRFYSDKGRPFASCELIEGDKSTDTRVVFNITEGPKVRVRDIDFKGNSFVSGAVLATHINSSHAYFGVLGGEYNPSMSHADALKLEAYYKAFGFHDVQVSLEPFYSEDQQTVTLIYHVKEGIRYRVTSAVVVDSNEKHREQLEPLATFQAGYYDERKSKKNIQRMKDEMGTQGIETNVIEKVVYDEKNPGQVTLNYQVVEQPPARVSEIKVIGNDVTRENVILRQMRVFPGQVLSFPDMRVSEERLARLGIFETNGETGIRPTVSVIPSDNPDSPYRDLLVQVQETRTGSLTFGLGVNSDAGLTGSIVLNERNFDITRFPTSIDDFLNNRAFRGAGQEFRIEAVPGTSTQRYDVSWREPFLFDSLYSLKLDTYYYTRDYTEYHESRLGERVTVGRKITDEWSLYGSVRVEDVGVHNVPFYAPWDFQKVEGDNFLVGVRGGATYDTRDSFMRPTKGTQVDMWYEQVAGSYTFPKVNIEASQYFTVYERADGSGKHVIALRSQIGYAGPSTPVFERFYAGGFQSLRGFAFRGVGPVDNGFEEGGDFMFLNSAEYQLPIKANDHLYFVAFLDSGTVEARPEIKDYRVSAGFGARVVVPMLGPLPIALDFGFPIVKGPNDKEQVFSFWLGFYH